MTEEQTRKLIGINAALLTAAALASFVLPLILDSMLDGRGNFIKALMHLFPLLAVMPFSCRLISVAAASSNASAETNDSAGA